MSVEKYLDEREKQENSQKAVLARALKDMRQKDAQQKARIVAAVKRAMEIASAGYQQAQELQGAMLQMSEQLNMNAAAKDYAIMQADNYKRIYDAFETLSSDVQKKAENALAESGKRSELRNEGGRIEWRKDEESDWKTLFTLNDVTGPRGLKGSSGNGAKGDKGDKGDNGDPGAAGAAGADGADGNSATITIGTVTTVAADQPATVTNVGTESAAVLDFEIPRGETGASGSGTGDMLASVYDTDEDGKVNAADDADTVGGHTVAADVPSDAVFTDTVYTHPSTHDASIINVSDSGAYFTGTNVETVLAEVGSLLVGLEDALEAIVGAET